MAAFGTPDRLASFGGVAPASRDSGKISGNLRRPQRYNRRLQRVFYTSALFSIRHSDESRRFYDRKRAKGKRRTQGRTCPGPSSSQCSLGSPARRAVLRTCSIHRPRSLRNGIRNRCGSSAM
ncbi:transposase [Streptomyces sp. NPDC059153]|uniref:transposase n=1 Tax=Streptomyces sp. NPDC059153 TaxID=3346743 RepID=UPI0036892331